MRRALPLISLLLLAAAGAEARPMRPVKAVPDVNASKANIALGSFKAVQLALSVPSIDESVAWYTQHLGFALKDPKAPLPTLNTQVALIEKDGFTLELYEAHGSDDEDGSARDLKSDLASQGLRHLVFQVENVDRTAEKLKTQGVRILADVTDLSEIKQRIFLIADNNGNAIEFMQPMQAALADAARE